MGFANHVVEPLLSAALNTLWQAGALALLVWMILHFLPRMNASTRHAVWWVSLGALLLLPAVSSVIHTRMRPGAAARQETAIVESAEPVSAARELPAEIGTPVEVRAGRLPDVVFGIWLGLALAQLMRILASYRYLRGVRSRARMAGVETQGVFGARLAQCGIRGSVRLLVSNEIASPMATGFLHPVVILPESLSGVFEESELDYVLLHELAHIARGDNWTNLAGRLASAVGGLHPVVWWILKRIERERELACDDWVVSFTGEARPYARSLARLFEICASRRQVLLATGMAGQGSRLGERIEGLLQGRNFSPGASLLRVVFCATVALGMVAVGTLAPRWIAFASDARPAPQARPAAAVTAAPAPSTGGLMAALSASGYGDLPVDEIISLKNAGVGPAFLIGMQRSGWGKPPVSQLIQLWQNGVSADYATAMGQVGMKNLTLPEVIRLKQHGVRPGFMNDIHGLGFGPFTAQEGIDLTSHGISLDTLRALKAAGLTGVGVPAITEAHNAGLREADVREAQRFSTKLTLEQILKLKRGGVI